MKRHLLVIVLLIVICTGAWAKGPQGITGSMHDFSNLNLANNTYAADNEEEVCIFCHTPHGGSLAAPLWNRSLPSATFTHYTSATLPLLGLSATRAVSPESLLCLACHDGTVAMNSLLNYSNKTGVPDGASAQPILPMFGPGAIIGEALNVSTDEWGGSTFLSDDHPISFSYVDVFDYGTVNRTILHDTPVAESKGIRFFPVNGIRVAGGKRVECSTCHDPHVDYSATGDPDYGPFLTTPNQGSALCLSCHIK